MRQSQLGGNILCIRMKEKGIALGGNVSTEGNISHNLLVGKIFYDFILFKSVLSESYRTLIFMSISKTATRRVSDFGRHRVSVSVSVSVGGC